MKNREHRIKLTLIVLCLFIGFLGHSQTTYLKITKSDKANDYVMYPPETKFELKNAHGYIVFKNSDKPGSIEIDKTYTLYVYPSWKEEKDVFTLVEGRLEKISISNSKHKTHKKSALINNDVTAEYTVTDSKESKNLEFELSNGITFRYTDGKYSAKLNDTYVNIEGKYVIATDIGTLKLSFNSKNGQLWWVFEAKKD